MRRARLVGLLWRWHRRLGLAAAIFLVLMSISGVALNHGSAIGLDRRYPGWRWLQEWYGDQTPQLVSFHSGDHWITQTTDGAVYLGAKRMALCDGNLIGTAMVHDLLLVGCAAELVLLDDHGNLVESLKASSGLPAPISGIGVAKGGVVLQAATRWHTFNYDTLEFPLLALDESHIERSTAAPTPPAIRDVIAKHAEWLSWERVLLDLHSGRIFGPAGEWLLDIAGAAFCVLGFSGVWMWWLHHRNRRHRILEAVPDDPRQQ